MVALFESCSAQSSPNVFPINFSSHFNRDLQVSALDGKIESGLWVLDKVKSDLWVTLLLQVANDTLSDKVTASDDLKNLVIVFANKSKLESILGRIDGDCSRLGSSVQTVYHLTLDSRQVDWLLKGLDDTVITTHQHGLRTSSRLTRLAKRI